MTKKELTQEDPQFLPTKYDLTKARLSMLTKAYDPALIPEALVKGDDGYQVIHEQTMAIIKVRTRIEKVRKELNSDALSWSKKVNGEAKRLTTIIEELEKPWRDIKTNLDEKEAREAEETRQAEAKLQDEIEQRIQNIKDLTTGLLGKDAAYIQDRLMKANGIMIDEEWYGDYVEPAEIVLATVVESLENAHTERLEFEVGQAEVQKQKDEMAENQRKMDEQQKDLDKQKAAQEASERASKAAKEKAEREAQEKKGREERAIREAQEAKKHKAELEARLPEDKKLRAYADELLSLKVPPIHDRVMMDVLARSLERLNSVALYIYDNTQGGES